MVGEMQAWSSTHTTDSMAAACSVSIDRQRAADSTATAAVVSDAKRMATAEPETEQAATEHRGIYACYILPPFHNISHSDIFHIHIDANESRHIYLSRFINITMTKGHVA